MALKTMLNLNPIFQIPKKGLYFLSLGGIGEIGANCYLYGSDNKWIMIDLGLTFADDKYPGIDLLLPKIDFLEKIKDNLEAIIISHGHEDHAGALAFFIDKINCPIYASGFASSIIKNRLKEFGKLNLANINIINSKKSLKFKNFEIKFISTTHSIPEPFSILITTKYGKLLHTADWKIDNDPQIGEDFDKKAFKDLGHKIIEYDYKSNRKKFKPWRQIGEELSYLEKNTKPDIIFLQRGRKMSPIAFNLLESPIIYWSTEPIKLKNDADKLLYSNKFEWVFVHSYSCLDRIKSEFPHLVKKCSVMHNACPKDIINYDTEKSFWAIFNRNLSSRRKKWLQPS